MKKANIWIKENMFPSLKIPLNLKAITMGMNSIVSYKVDEPVSQN